MTRNDGEYLKQCIESIFNTVKMPITVYIVDNNSDSQEHLDIVASLSSRFESVRVVYNKQNLWVLGLNKTINSIRDLHVSKYFFLTDADIDFSKCETPNRCWLSYLTEKMDENLVVGKLGLSLNWDYISTQPDFFDIYKQEKSLYNESRKINELYISQVDTTACLFRIDWSIESSGGLYPDHMRYLRPELYSCRTPKNITVEHLGWYKYHKNALPQKQINDKVICFTIVGASLKDEIRSQASFLVRKFSYFFTKPFLYFWVLRRYCMLARYIWCHGRRCFDGQK
ncbi:glycosyltransferase family 2 protein [Aeromonas hydrophila]|uniref:glycosyltransferase family A protein n=1 Tax=Aeromonas TaxID=642 RepID=UPI002379A094|nr:MULTISPECIES: glycosyltransferase family 2 protein [Aeromonas]MDD9224720.1 glycosyltransferase family 2 protein [Aeromonas hydrophila]MDX7919654.1 glycosyltransferase family 2 protein [Aeromonas caviae]